MEADQDSNVLAYDRESDTYWKIQCRYIPASYPGTGDAYTSVMIGSLLEETVFRSHWLRSPVYYPGDLASYGSDYPEEEGVLLESVLEVPEDCRWS
jgi:pyridoxine kinase